MAKKPSLSTRSRGRRDQSPSPPAPERQGWMGDAEFEGPEDLAACGKFLRDIAALLAEEEQKLKRRLRPPAGRDVGGQAVVGAGHHQR
jgi:hypothetical protein